MEVSHSYYSRVGFRPCIFYTGSTKSTPPPQTRHDSYRLTECIALLLGGMKGVQPPRLLCGGFGAAAGPERQYSHKGVELWKSQFEIHTEKDDENVYC
jgi:hypothetical protein